MLSRGPGVVVAVVAAMLVSCEPAPIAVPRVDDGASADWEPSADWPKLPAGKSLGRVLGVAIDASGLVWISHTGEDDAHPEILGLDPATGSIQQTIDASDLRTPHALAFDAEGRLWVTDDGADRVVVFEQGRMLRTIGGN